MVLERILQDLDPKSLPQAKSLTQELSYKHLSDMASSSSSCKDLLERISPGSPQDLLLRACTVYRIMQGPLRKDFTKTRDLLIRICERSRKDLLQDASRIFTRSSQKEGYKIMQEPLTVFYRDLHNIFSQGSPQNLGRDLDIPLGPTKLQHETLARS